MYRNGLFAPSRHHRHQSVLVPTWFTCFGIDCSNPFSSFIGLVTYDLGAGFGSLVRGMLASLTPSSHHSLMFSLLGTLDVLGTLIGALFWPEIWGIGLKLGPGWTGLPFAVAAVMLLLAYISVEVSGRLSGFRRLT
jgi:hypothetical protein